MEDCIDPLVKPVPMRGTYSDVSGMRSERLSPSSWKAKSTVSPSETFSPVSRGIQKPGNKSKRYLSGYWGVWLIRAGLAWWAWTEWGSPRGFGSCISQIGTQGFESFLRSSWAMEPVVNPWYPSFFGVHQCLWLLSGTISLVLGFWRGGATDQKHRGLNDFIIVTRRFCFWLSQYLLVVHIPMSPECALKCWD